MRSCFSLFVAVFCVGMTLCLMTDAQGIFHPKIKIMPFGDSLTAGAYLVDGTYHTDSGYRETLWDLLNEAHKKAHFVGTFQDGLPGFTERNHEGHSGMRIDQISEGAKAWTSTNHPDVVLLLIGTNDCIQNNDLPHAMDRMQQLIENIQSSAPHALIFISTTIPNANPDVQARVVRYNQDLRTWISEKQKTDPSLHLVEMNAPAGPEASDLRDGVHPTPEGYAKMGQIWFQAIRNFL